MFIWSNFNTISSAQFDHGYSTRNKEDFRFPKHHLKVKEKSPMYMGKTIFNRLPTNIKEEITKICIQEAYNKSLTRFLLEKSYYSLMWYLSGSTQA